MPTLHLLHGLPGSGKTGFAKKLARELPAVRFTPDEWMVTLHGTNPPEAVFRPQHEKIMMLIWLHVERALRAETDVVLDVGFWSRASRDDARARARSLGAPCRFYAMRCSSDEARRRVLTRTAMMPPGELEISEPTFEFLARQMEPMGADEPHIVVEPPAPDISRSANPGDQGMKASAMIGLRRGIVEVRPYDPAWVEAYTNEAERLRATLGPDANHLEHVGSTAVSGLAAKPVIDMALGLSNWSHLDDVTARLREIGYTSFGERERPGDHFFALGQEELRTHYLHVVSYNGIRWINYLLFRDRLLADPALRETYGRLKIELASRYAADRPAYLAAKEQFISSALSS